MTPVLVALLIGLAVAAWAHDAPIGPSAARGWLCGDGGPPAPPEEAGMPLVAVADIAELLALALGSGCGVLEAIEAVGDGLDGLAGRYLRAVAAAQRWGLTPTQAWAGVPAGWDPIARALRLADRAGVPPAALLLDAAADVRKAEAHRLEVATARLGVRIVLPLGLTFLPAFVATTVVPVVLALAGAVLAG